MLTVAEALERVEKVEVALNAEVLRRWLREGKIKGAVIRSKREGWSIPEAEIDKIIATRKEKSSNNQKDYQAGYKKAQQEYHERLKAVAQNGGFEERIWLNRQDFRELAPLKSKEFLKFADDHFWKRGVKNPRKEIEVNILDGWFSYDRGVLTLDSAVYATEKDLALTDQAIAVLGEYLRKKFILEKKEQEAASALLEAVEGLPVHLLDTEEKLKAWLDESDE